MLLKPPAPTSAKPTLSAPYPTISMKFLLAVAKGNTIAKNTKKTPLKPLNPIFFSMPTPTKKTNSKKYLHIITAKASSKKKFSITTSSNAMFTLSTEKKNSKTKKDISSPPVPNKNLVQTKFSPKLMNF